MIGIAICTHRNLGAELLVTAECIMGTQERVVAVPITVRDSLTSLLDTCAHAIGSVNDGSGVLVLTDMLGGSASNVCLRVVTQSPMEIITGVNLPMLLSAFVNRGRMDLAALAEKALVDGKKAMVNARQLYMEKLR